MRTPILFLNVLIIAACGLIYELLAGTVASYVLGDSVTQFSLIIGIYLSALGVGACYFVQVPDVDRFARRLKKRRFKPLLPPKTQFYGLRECHVADPDGAARGKIEQERRAETAAPIALPDEERVAAPRGGIEPAPRGDQVGDPVAVQVAGLEVVELVARD